MSRRGKQTSIPTYRDALIRYLQLTNPGSWLYDWTVTMLQIAWHHNLHHLQCPQKPVRWRKSVKLSNGHCPAALGIRPLGMARTGKHVETWPLENRNRYSKLVDCCTQSWPSMTRNSSGSSQWRASYLGVDVMAISRQLNIDNQSMKSQLTCETCVPKAGT